MSPAVSIQTARRVRLKSLLMGQEEGLRISEVVGSIAPGHAAQVETQANEPGSTYAPPLHESASDREPPQANSVRPCARVLRVGTPGFPSIGAGRAVRLRQGSSSTPMAGRLQELPHRPRDGVATGTMRRRGTRGLQALRRMRVTMLGAAVVASLAAAGSTTRRRNATPASGPVGRQRL